jgi:cytochrome b561
MSAVLTAPAVDTDRYRLPAIVLHWLIALLIIGMLSLGYYMTDLPKNTPERSFYLNLHKSCGLLAALLILLRVGWRVSHLVPAFPATMPSWETLAARWSHWLLYACMVLQPLTGYLSSSFNKFGIKFFGLSLPNWGWEDKNLRELFAGFHEVIAGVLIALIVIHVLAALKHLLIDRDRVFQRMLP